MIGDNGLLSTLLGGLQMDAWLKNWIDEWDAQYEQMQTDRKESSDKKTKPNMWLRFFSKKSEVEA
tara:strand:+ start:502 stop:696 length:195 start_codon:yes stop_codon:yes gene_type:complete